MRPPCEARRGARIVRSGRRVAFAAAAAAALPLLTWLHERYAEWRFPARGHGLAINGRRVHVVERGHGRPVVLLHGLRGSTRDFEHSILGHLAASYRAIAVDRPGYGFSEPQTGPPGSPIAQTDVLHEVLERLDARPAVLVGHSLGAAVAMTHAVRYPKDVAAVVSLCGHVLPFDGWVGALARLSTTKALGTAFLRAVVTPLGIAAAPLVLRYIFFPQRPPREYARAAASLAVRPGAFLASSQDRRYLDDGLRSVYRDYQQVRAPVVILCGRADRIVSPSESHSLHRLLPRSELTLLPGIGHMPQFAAPTAVLAAVDRAWELAEDGGTGRQPA